MFCYTFFFPQHHMSFTSVNHLQLSMSLISILPFHSIQFHVNCKFNFLISSVKFLTFQCKNTSDASSRSHSVYYIRLDLETPDDCFGQYEYDFCSQHPFLSSIRIGRAVAIVLFTSLYILKIHRKHFSLFLSFLLGSFAFLFLFSAASGSNPKEIKCQLLSESVCIRFVPQQRCARNLNDTCLGCIC